MGSGAQGPTKRERRALQFSLLGSGTMAALGFGFAFLSGSRAVLLDGLFSLVSVAMGLLTLWVLGQVHRPDDERYQLGYVGFEPLLNVAKGILWTVLCLLALASAVQSIFEGGQPVASGPALLYAAVVSAGCLGLGMLLWSAWRHTRSPMLRVEARGWLLDGVLSVAVLVAFGVLRWMEGGPLEIWAPFVDPAVVVVMVLGVIPSLGGIIMRGIRGLLSAPPTEELQEEVRETLAEVLSEVPHREAVVRMMQTGRYRYVHVVVVLGPERGWTLAALDRLRADMVREVRSVAADLDVDVIFTREIRWAEPFDEALRLETPE